MNDSKPPIPNPPLIFKIVNADQWAQAQRDGVLTGSPIDQHDGFMHFSTAEQVAQTHQKHFAGQSGLLLLHVDAGFFKDAAATDGDGPALRYEISRGGALFPHLYAAMPVAAVIRVESLATVSP